MSVTVESIVNTINFDLLEDTGLSLGLVTQGEVLDLLGQVLMDYLRKTGITWGVYTQQFINSQTQYAVPDLMPNTFYCFSNSVIIEQVDLFSEYLQGNWKLQIKPAKAWHADGLPIQTVEVMPTTPYSGTATSPTYGTFQPGNHNLTMVGSTIASKETWNIGDTLDTIPDSLTPYLVYGILERLFSMDGENKDLQRAQYCRSRYTEGISLGRGILMEYAGGEAEQREQQASK